LEIIDTISGHSIATRYVDETGRINVAGLDLLLNGDVATGDSFTIAANTRGAGDGRNISQILALQSLNKQTGQGGFATSFSALITDMGAKVKAGTIAAESAEAVRDAARELESEFSGVNLDTEAARLLEQQQAYQALARVLSTAKELLDTLMNSI
jgi:flagellar hook-associated protein 1 FlgK